MNAPIIETVDSTSTITGSVSVDGVVVRAYVDDGETISPAPSPVTCNPHTREKRSLVCDQLDAACRIWVIIAPNLTVTGSQGFGPVLNRGIATSNIIGQEPRP